MYSQRFGQWVVTVLTVESNVDPQHVEIQDCATGATRTLPGIGGHHGCSGYSIMGMSRDGRSLLYACSWDGVGSEVVVHDPISGKVQQVPTPPSRPWAGGSLSPDGRFVAFTGQRSVWHQYTPSDVFVFDRTTGRTEQLPREYDGVADRDSQSLGVSVGGRYVGVASVATSDNPSALYRYDRVTHEFLRVTSEQGSGGATMSGDGQHFVFQSRSGQDDAWGVYVADIGAAAPVRISDCTPANAGNPDCYESISDDGNLVTFSTWPGVTVTGTSDTGGGTYTYDRRSGAVQQDWRYPCPWYCYLTTTTMAP